MNGGAIASSANGEKLAACVIYGGNIWTLASDSWSWTANTSGLGGTQQWTSVASNTDGTKLAAVVRQGNIWTSTNSGVSWTERVVGSTEFWASIASSADGTKLAAVISGGSLWTSTTSGVSWMEQPATGSPRNWADVASDADWRTTCVG